MIKASLLRIARILIAQVIGIVITTWGSITIPYVGLTIGAALNGLFKYIRDKYPKSKVLEWLPL